MKKKCNTCKQLKSKEDDFYKGRQSECKECTKARVKQADKNDPDRKRDRHLRRTYGISLADFNRMVLSQGNRCACCGTDKAGGKSGTWNVDHDHTTGNVRQLLCKDCNIVLGIVEDSPEHLQRLIDYVLRHSPHNSSLSSELFNENNN